MHKHKKFHAEFTTYWVSRHPLMWLSNFPHANCGVAISGPGGQTGHNLQSTQKSRQNLALKTPGFCPVYSCWFLGSQLSSHPRGLVTQDGWLQPRAENSSPQLCTQHRNWQLGSNIPEDTACRTATVLPRAGLVTPLPAELVPSLCRCCVGALRSVRPLPSAEVNAQHLSKTNANLYTIWHQFLSLDTIFCPLSQHVTSIYPTTHDVWPNYHSNIFPKKRNECN